MTTRLLPREEWYRLEGTEAERLWPLLNDSQTRVVVVEEDGKIVGCHVLMWVLHAECLWIAPDKRARASVARRLWNGVQEMAAASGVRAVMTAAADDKIRGLIAHAGGTHVPGDHYVLPVHSAEERREESIGRRFHNQLEQQLTSENHPEDRAHNMAVGHALRIAIEVGDVESAIAGYNAWAEAAGYIPLILVDKEDGSWVVDMQTAVIRIDSDFSVTVLEERVPSCQ